MIVLENINRHLAEGEEPAVVVGQGDPLRYAVVEWARIRMRPILITALATVMGLLPIALTSEASAPLARAAIGGLAASTILALILVPCMYELLYSRRGNAVAR